MPLAGTEEKLAKVIAKAVASDTENQATVQADWKKVAAAIIDHLVAETLITGTCDGKPLTLGKIT